jgi:hypothetical protein
MEALAGETEEDYETSLGSIARETAEIRTEDLQNIYLGRYSRTSNFNIVTAYTLFASLRIYDK